MSPERPNLASEGAAHLKAGLLRGSSHPATTDTGCKEKKPWTVAQIRALMLNCLTQMELTERDRGRELRQSHGGAAV